MEQKTDILNEVKAKSRPALSGWPMIFGWLAMLIFAFHASTHMVGAGDTWVAMACGRHFINHGVDTVEPFSANSHKAGPTEVDVKTWPDWAQWITDKVGLETVKYWHPTGWVNQNWLTHVIFYWLTHLSPFADADNYSFNTLVYLKFAIYIITVICVYYTGRLLGANPALSAVFACFAMFVGRSFFDIRPAGFSNLLVAVFLLILVLTTYRNVLYIWLIVPVAVFWCNVHGGYIYLFIMLVPFVVLNFLTSFSRKWFVSIGLKGIYHTVAAGFVAFIAVVIFNPFHLTNLSHTFAISVSKHAEMWRSVNEWHPGFEWSNPVGTGFPFLILFILSIGLPFFWLFSRFLKPRLLKAPKNELDRQRKLFTTLSKIFGCEMAVFLCWVSLISFSFVEADAFSFILCALFVGILLLSIYKNVHFIYLALLLTLLAVWSGDAEKGYTGRYIYPFCLLPAYVILHIFASMFSEKVKIKPSNIIFVVLTVIAALFLMEVIFDPFKFKFEIPSWVIKSDEGFWSTGTSWLWALGNWFGRLVGQFFVLKRQWRPRYERSNPLGYSNLFIVLYIVNVASVIIWLAVESLKKSYSRPPDKIDTESQADLYQLPKIDLALMSIAALTIYMAYRSRRFIPIAAIAACPIIAMFIDQMVRTISASRNFHRRNSPSVNSMPYNLQVFFSVTAVVAVLIFGTWWGLKFRSVYLDFWPADAELNSVFIRMTASNVKPFYAGKFIKDNKLKGKMYNYWTEGGFIAWSQEPDPNTGRTPLQLFMDGRAQAAYEPEAYRNWDNILKGGPFVRSAMMRRQKFDYAKIGRWVSGQLKKRDVWVVLMPMTDPKMYKGPFLKGLERDPDWQIAFFNNKQKLFVDRTTPQGKKLLDGIFTGETIYPDEFSKNLIIAHTLLSFGEEKEMREQGLDFAFKAFELKPSQAPMQVILTAARFPELRPRIADFCRNYFEHFSKNKHLYAKQDGYLNRIWAALIAVDYLQRVAKMEKNAELMKFYDAERKELRNEERPLKKTKRW